MIFDFKLYKKDFITLKTFFLISKLNFIIMRIDFLLKLNNLYILLNVKRKRLLNEFFLLKLITILLYEFYFYFINI